MKCYKIIVPLHELFTDDESEDIQPDSAKILGSSIVDGRYNGVCDGSAGLLHGQYDNDSSMTVDPLCDLSTDVFGMRSGSTPVPAASSSGDNE